VLLVVGAVLVAVSVGHRERAGQGIAAERIDLWRSDVPIRVVGSFGDAPGGSRPTDALADSAGGDAVVAAVLSDLQDFWDLELSADGGPGLDRPTGGYVSMDSTSTAGGSALCITNPRQISGNAFYCPDADGIVFDSSALVPVLLGSYGSAGLTTAFAHEFGHAVQAQIGPTPEDRRADPERYPAILIEAQADCDAGAFLAWVSDGSAAEPGAESAASAGSAAGSTDGAAAGSGPLRNSRVHIPQQSLVRAVAPLLDFRDPATVSPADPTAHGLGLDRLGFVLAGFRGGAAACTAMTTADLRLTLGRAGVTTSPPSTLSRYPSTQEVLTAATASVRAFAESVGRGSDLPEVLLADSADVAGSARIGQFAAGAAVALAAGRSIAADGGPAGDGDSAEHDAVAACFTGAWSASVFGHAGVDELGSWPTDADEALDLIRGRPGVTFGELAAYSDGFHRGWAACG
jgi:hypothetical protein